MAVSFRHHLAASMQRRAWLASSKAPSSHWTDELGVQPLVFRQARCASAHKRAKLALAFRRFRLASAALSPTS
eukprot:5134604-Pleurochrysis_carterae.AAC.1